MTLEEILRLNVDEYGAFFEPGLPPKNEVHLSHTTFDEYMRESMHRNFNQILLWADKAQLHLLEGSEIDDIYDIPLDLLNTQEELMTWVKITCALGG